MASIIFYRKKIENIQFEDFFSNQEKVINDQNKHQKCTRYTNKQDSYEH